MKYGIGYFKWTSEGYRRVYMVVSLNRVTADVQESHRM